MLSDETIKRRRYMEYDFINVSAFVYLVGVCDTKGR